MVILNMHNHSKSKIYNWIKHSRPVARTAKDTTAHVRGSGVVRKHMRNSRRHSFRYGGHGGGTSATMAVTEMSGLLDTVHAVVQQGLCAALARTGTAEGIPVTSADTLESGGGVGGVWVCHLQH